jgi:hypothetical protein
VSVTGGGGASCFPLAVETAIVSVKAEVPVGVTVGAGVVVCTRVEEALLPPPHPAEPYAASRTEVVSSPPSAQRQAGPMFSRGVLRTRASKGRRHITKSGSERQLANGAAGGQGEMGIITPLPLVLTATEKGIGLPLITCSTEGAVHVAAAGVPAQTRETSPLKPVPGVNCKLN